MPPRHVVAGVRAEKAPLRSRWLWVAALCCASVGFAANWSTAADDFEHMRTGFVLTGVHERISCESCHVGGVFEGTPRNCETCHAPSGPWGASFKPNNHVPSSNACDDCHITSSWASARFDHTGITSGCVRCHNGSTADGEDARATCPSVEHLRGPVTSHGCLEPVRRFDHAGVTGNCLSLPQRVDGDREEYEPPANVPTPADCDECHTTVAWTGRRRHSTTAGVTGLTASELPQRVDGDREEYEPPAKRRTPARTVTPRYAWTGRRRLRPQRE